jgi:hypothetical protein
MTENELTKHALMLNQVFQIERKLARLDKAEGILRNLSALKDGFAELGLSYESPLGQRYDETRTDCEASIAGEVTEDLVIADVIKPAIRLNEDGRVRLVQKAVVVVSARDR